MDDFRDKLVEVAANFIEVGRQLARALVDAFYAAFKVIKEAVNKIWEYLQKLEPIPSKWKSKWLKTSKRSRATFCYKAPYINRFAYRPQYR